MYPIQLSALHVCGFQYTLRVRVRLQRKRGVVDNPGNCPAENLPLKRGAWYCIFELCYDTLHRREAHSIRNIDVVPRRVVTHQPGAAGGRAAQARPRRSSAGSVAEPRPTERLPRPGGRSSVSAASERERKQTRKLVFCIHIHCVLVYLGLTRRQSNSLRCTWFVC